MSDAKIIISAEDQTRAAFASVKSGLQGVSTSAAGVTAVLGALGVTAAALNFAQSIHGAIDAADQMNKLSQRTGIATESLSQLQFAAKLSDVSTESLTNGIKKLNVSIAAGLGGDKAKIEMFTNLGISLTDAAGKAKTADKVMLEMADAFSTAKDGATKTAYAVGLMGKAGDEMIPLLNGGGAAIADMMKKAEKLGLTISTDFARQAEEFNDNLTIVQASSKRLSISLAGDLVAGLGKVVKAMADASIEGGKFSAILLGLQTLITGDDRHKNNVALVEDTEKLMNLQNGLDKLRAAGYTSDTLAYKSQQKQIDEVNARLKVTIGYRGMLNEADAKVASAEAAKPKQDGNLKALTGGGATTSEYDAIIKRIKERIALTDAELKKGRELTDEEKFSVKALADVDAAKKALNATQKKTIDGMLAESALKSAQKELDKQALKSAGEFAKEYFKEQDEMAAAAKSRTDERDKVNKAIADQAVALGESNDQLNLEAKLFSATEREREVALGNLRIEAKLKRDLLDLDRDLLLSAEARAAAQTALQNNAEVERAQVAQRANLSEMQRVWGSVDQTAHDVFVNIFESGSSTFKKLGQTLKASVLDLLYQMTIKRWIFEIGASSTGQSISGVVSGGGGVGSILSGAGSAASLYSNGAALGGLFSSNAAYGAAIGTTNIAAGSQAALLAAQTGEFGLAGVAATSSSAAVAGGVGSGAAGALGAIPVYGWVAMAALAAYAIFSKKGGGPKEDGQSGAYGDLTGSLGGQVTAAKKNRLGGVLDPVVTGLQTQYNSMAKLFGGEAAVQFGLAISRDPKGDSPTFLETYGQKDGKDLFRNVNLNVGRSEEDLSKAFVAATTDSLIGALKASNLSPQFAAYFDTIAGDASTEVKQAALTTATSVTQLTDAMAWLGEDFSGLSVQARANMINLAGGLDALVSATQSYRQNFFTEAENQDATWRKLVKDFSTLGVVLPSTNAGFRQLLEGLDKDSPLYMAVLALSPAFAKLYPMIQATGTAAAAATDNLQIHSDLALDEVNRTQSVLMDAYQREAAAKTDIANRARAAAVSLRQMRDAMFLGEDSPLGLSGRTDMAGSKFEDTFAKALGGDLTSIASLQGDSTAYLEALKNSSPTKTDFNIGFARIAAGLTLTAAKSDSVATIAESDLAIQTAQLSALGLINTTLVSFGSALQAYTGAKTAYIAATPAASAIDGLYQSVLGRTGDMGGLAFYQGWLDRGLTLSDVEAAMRASPEGSHEGGLDFVSKNNYRASLHYGERVKTARASRQEDAVASEIKQMRMELRICLEAIADHSLQTRKNTQEMKDRGVPALNAPDGEVLVTTT